MSRDPYEVLGVKQGATQDEIQKAYRGIAKKLHPDLNPGNKSAEEQFKEVSAAYDLLGDADKRARYDHGDIDASGTERPRQRYYRDFAQGGTSHPYASDAGFADFADVDDILAEVFRQRGDNLKRRGADSHYRLALEFLDAINGAKRAVTMPDGSELEVAIPPGTRDGQTLRLRGKGGPGIGDAPPGDALIEVQVRPHHLFSRNGDDIRVELPLALADAVLGGKVTVPTPSGPVAMKVPKWTNTGTVLRLKGKGAPRADGSRGDEYVTFKVVLPETSDPALERLIAEWRAAKNNRPRQAMGA